MATILIKKVPEDLRLAFKILCISQGTNMSAEIIKFMEREVKRQKGKEKVD